jgi:hypothetical protein
MYQFCTTDASQSDAPSVVVAMPLDDLCGSCALLRGTTANLAALRSVNQGSYVAHTYWLCPATLRLADLTGCRNSFKSFIILLACRTKHTCICCTTSKGRTFHSVAFHGPLLSFALVSLASRDVAIIEFRWITIDRTPG